MRALVVDDQPDLRDALAGVMETRGHSVVACADGATGWAACQREPFDLVLLDVGLPGLDGLEVCRRLRARPGGDRPAVLMVTGSLDPTDLERIAAAGADDYLAKPFRLEDLGLRLAFAERRAVRSGDGMLLRTLMEHVPDFLYVKDAEHRFVRVNRAVADFLGLADPAGAVGKTDADFFPPELAEQFRADEARVLATGEPIFNRLEPQDAAGTVWALTSTVPVTDAAGRVTGLVGIVRDVTVRREMEEALRRQVRERELLDRVRAALARELDLPLLFRAVVAAITEAFGYTQVSLYLVEGDALVLQHQVGYDRVIDRVPLAAGIAGRVARTGAPVLLEDVRDDPAFLGAIDGIASEVCVPLRDEDRVVGILNVESTGGVVLTEADLALVTAVAEHVGVAIGRARLHTEVRASEERFRRAFDDAPIGMALVGLDQRFLRVNRALCALLGYAEVELLALTTADVAHPDDHRATGAQVRRLLAGEAGTVQLEKRYRHRDGHELVVLLGVSLVRDPAGAPRHFVAQLLDVTARKQAEAAERESAHLLSTVLATVAEGVIVRDATGTIVFANRSAECILGRSSDQLLGQRALASPDLAIREDGSPFPLTELPAQATLRTGEPATDVVMGLARTGGAPTWLSVTSRPLLRPNAASPAGVVTSFTDITARKAMEARLAHQATHDALTGLPNRALLADRLAHALARSGRSRRPLAVLFIDLDDFKVVNDTLGHAAGDRLLAAIAERLRGCVREVDTVARLGGDEFAVLLEDLGSRAEATIVAERIVAALAAPVRLAERVVGVAASVGIAVCGRERLEPEELLRRADAAMYAAKRTGKGRVVAYAPRLDAGAWRRLDLLTGGRANGHAEAPVLLTAGGVRD